MVYAYSEGMPVFIQIGSGWYGPWLEALFGGGGMYYCERGEPRVFWRLEVSVSLSMWPSSYCEMHAS
jgi:hypothetical protein